MTAVIEQPLDLVRLAIDEVVRVQMRGERHLKGKLHVRFVIHLAQFIRKGCSLPRNGTEL